jgi:membrane protein YdbS with pleckstrin-like domain
VGIAMVLGSVVVAGAILLRFFGADNVADAIAQANIWLIALVVLLGAVIQLVRAQRARCMLADDDSVSLPHTYGAMVLGHGLGDLLPLAPGGPLLRCFLTERLSGIPAAFSAGVFMLEGMLDGLGPALLIGYLLLALSIPRWTRWALVAALLQSTVVLLLPALAKVLPRYAHMPHVQGRRVAGLLRLGHQITDGLVTVVARGPRSAGKVLGLSLLVTLLNAVQMALFLHAFDLGASFNALLLLLVLTLASGSLPIKIPGAGTLATTAVLGVAGIHGAGVAGYVLVSRVVLSSETAFLALALLVWWSITGQWSRIGVHSLGAMLRGQHRPEAVPIPVDLVPPQ